MAATVEASPDGCRDVRTEEAGDCERPVVSASFERRTRLLRQRGAALDVAGIGDRKRERRLRQTDLRRVRPGRCERERALADLDRGVEVELFGREEAETAKRVEPPIERNVVRRLGERELDESPPFGHALREREVPGERRQAGGDAGVACIASVRERGPQVVVLEVEPADPGLPFASAKLRPRCVGERREVLGVRPPGGGETAVLGKTLERVLPHRVEQVVARTFGGERHGEDRLVDQHAEQVRHGRLVEPFARTDGVTSDGNDAPPRCTATWWSSDFSSACKRS